jgi:hypothetical protein
MILKTTSLFPVKSELGPFLFIPFKFMSYFFSMSVNIVFTLLFFFVREKHLFSLFCPNMFHIFCPPHCPLVDKTKIYNHTL